jgi:hypothetical protein
MTHTTVISQSEPMAITAIAGLIFGSLYFAALKCSVALFVGGHGWLGPLTLMLGRIGAAAGFLFVAAKLGAAPLLTTFIGFLMARAVALRAERRVG